MWFLKRVYFFGFQSDDHKSKTEQNKQKEQELRKRTKEKRKIHRIIEKKLFFLLREETWGDSKDRVKSIGINLSP